MKKDEDKFIVRLPDGMRDELKAEAVKNERSLNAEIVYRLKVTIDYENYIPALWPGS